MRRLVAALAVACFLLPACASQGEQMAVFVPHNDARPKGAVRVATADLAADNQCYGDGQSGKRVQAVYVVASDKVDRYASLLPSIRAWMGNVDAAINESAAKTGGTAHVRWACAGGVPDVVHYVGSPVVDDDFATSGARSELRAAGFNRTDRKYVLWTDATVHCGIAEVNDSPETTGGLARIDSGCWGLSQPVEMHELGHILGAVPLNANDSDGNRHCKTGGDRMCSYYATLPGCPSAEGRHYDCFDDSYANWSATPPPMPLNLARSGYFESTYGSGSTSTPSPTVSTPAPSTSSPPPPTTSPSPTPTKKCPPKSNKPGCR